MLSLPLAGIGAVAGIFGMNLRSGLEEAAHVFALVSGVPRRQRTGRAACRLPQPPAAAARAAAAPWSHNHVTAHALPPAPLA